MPVTNGRAHFEAAVLTADAIARYMPGMRSDPFCFKRMLNRFGLGVEDPGKYGDYLKHAQAKDREEREKRQAVQRPASRNYRRARHTKPAQEEALA